MSWMKIGMFIAGTALSGYGGLRLTQDILYDAKPVLDKKPSLNYTLVLRYPQVEGREPEYCLPPDVILKRHNDHHTLLSASIYQGAGAPSGRYTMQDDELTKRLGGNVAVQYVGWRDEK